MLDDDQKQGVSGYRFEAGQARYNETYGKPTGAGPGKEMSENENSCENE